MSTHRAPVGTAEGGSTLIELLVVMVVIAVLAAIATPVYLSQREHSFDSAATSDLRVWAEREDTMLISHDHYGAVTDLDADGPALVVSPQVTVSVVRYSGATGYCLSAKHALSGTTWFWDSRAGGLQAKGATDCPVATTGPGGGSRTG